MKSLGDANRYSIKKVDPKSLNTPLSEDLDDAHGKVLKAMKRDPELHKLVKRLFTAYQTEARQIKPKNVRAMMAYRLKKDHSELLERNNLTPQEVAFFMYDESQNIERSF